MAGMSLFSLLLIPALITLLFLHFTGNYLLGILGFYLLPGICVAIREKKFPLRPILFSLVASIPFTVVVDYIGTVSNLWIVPASLLPRFLGIIPFEDYVWLASAVFSIIMVSGIAHKNRIKIDSKKLTVVLALVTAFLILFFILYITFGKSFFVFNSPYLYLILATLFFGLPTLLLEVHSREKFTRHLPVVGYFLLLTVLFEITAITHSWWEFTGSYFLRPLIISGKILPFEELFFVGLIGPCMAILLYQFIFQEKTEHEI